MKDIKFRALGTQGWKATENNGWYYGTLNYEEYVGDNKKHQHMQLGTFFRHLHGNYLNKNTLCEYTGLKDKNGVEIYCDDIVQIELDIDNFANAVIKFNVEEGSYEVEYIDYECIEHFNDWTSIDHFEVIGNIHQNQELLNG